MTADKVTDAEWAASLTGCVLDDSTGYAFCAAHDEDGNPPWHRCRWAPIAAALAEEREKARAPYEEAIDAVLAYCNEMDQADFFPGLADTDAIRTRLATVDIR